MRGALASALFAMLAASVSENAAAQVTCGANQELNAAGDGCVCSEGFSDSDTSAPLVCVDDGCADGLIPYLLSSGVCISTDDCASDEFFTDLTHRHCRNPQNSAECTTLSSTAIYFVPGGNAGIFCTSDCTSFERAVLNADGSCECPHGQHEPDDTQFVCLPESCNGVPDCEFARNNAQCRTIDSSMPIYEPSTGECRAIRIGDCPDGQALVSGNCQAPVTGAECAGAHNRNFIGIQGGNCVNECPENTGLNASLECVNCGPGETAENNMCISRCNGMNEEYSEADSACRCVSGYENEDGSSTPPCLQQACEPPRERQTDGSCSVTCTSANQVPNEAGDRCVCAMNFADSDMTDAILVCEMIPDCDTDNNQFLDQTDNECDCEEGFADSDTSTPELTCTQTPMCDTQNNQFLDTMVNQCDCVNMFEDLDDTNPLECVPVCVPPQERQPDDSCAEPATPTCDSPATLNAENECVCESPNREVGGVCEEPCDAPLTPNEQNICHCNPDTHFGDTASCVVHRECPLDSEVRNADDNTCICADNFQGEAGSCDACTGGKTSAAGADCACPANLSFEDPDTGICEASLDGTCVAPRTYASETNTCDCPSNLPFENTQGTCEASLDGTCVAPRTYASETNTCDCPLGQRDSADGSACEAIPVECGENEIPNDSGVCESCPDGQRVNEAGDMCEAIPAASGGGGSSGGGGGGGAAAAIIAVPVVLIGGYWLLGGFEYLSPAYGLDYSGENGGLDWRGNAGFNLRHGGLRSYANAVQSNGDAVSYESGISFEADNFALTYAATESQSDYDFDLGAEMGYNLGVMEIAPTAAASLQYRTGEETWNAETTAGVSAAWTAHRWIVRAQSDFSEDGAYSFSVIRSF